MFKWQFYSNKYYLSTETPALTRWLSCDPGWGAVTGWRAVTVSVSPSSYPGRGIHLLLPESRSLLAELEPRLGLLSLHKGIKWQERSVQFQLLLRHLVFPCDSKIYSCYMYIKFQNITRSILIFSFLARALQCTAY